MPANLWTGLPALSKEFRNYDMEYEDNGEKKTVSLIEALQFFRGEYNEVQEINPVKITIKEQNGNEETEKTIEIPNYVAIYTSVQQPQNNYTSRHKQVIEKAINEGKLTLGTTNYAFRGVASKKTMEEIVVAIPFDVTVVDENGNPVDDNGKVHHYCASPAEIRASITGNARSYTSGSTESTILMISPTSACVSV